MRPALSQTNLVDFAWLRITTHTRKAVRCVGLYSFISDVFSHRRQYLSRVMQRRDGPPNLDNINDTRNGLLLYYPLHKVFGRGEVAFLKVMTSIITMQVFIAESRPFDRHRISPCWTAKFRRLPVQFAIHRPMRRVASFFSILENN